MSHRSVLLVVAALILDGDGRVLITQRPAHKSLGGLWEFPGGKLEHGESPEAALVRELKEEIGVSVDPEKLEPFTFASHAYDDKHLLMPLYLVRDWQGEPRGSADAVSDLAFVPPDELPMYKMPPADVPLVQKIIERLGRAS